MSEKFGFDFCDIIIIVIVIIIIIIIIKVFGTSDLGLVRYCPSYVGKVSCVVFLIEGSVCEGC